MNVCHIRISLSEQTPCFLGAYILPGGSQMADDWQVSSSHNLIARRPIFSACGVLFPPNTTVVRVGDFYEAYRAFRVAEPYLALLFMHDVRYHREHEE